MPHMDGLQATANIMTNNPRPIVIVSSESKEGASSTLKALELGAIDFVTKPSSGVDLDMNSVKEELLRKVRWPPKFASSVPPRASPTPFSRRHTMPRLWPRNLSPRVPLP